MSRRKDLLDRIAPPARQPKDEPTPREIATSLATFEQAIGGRQVLLSALLFCRKTQDLEYLVGLLTDPLHKDKSLGQICRVGGVYPGELLHYFHQAQMTEAILRAQRPIAHYLPQVTEDVMRRALPYEEDCQRCLGAKVIGEGDDRRECPDCHGVGLIRVEPDLERQKVALQLGGFLKRDPLIKTTNVQLPASPGGDQPGTLEQIQFAMSRILSRVVPPPVIEATPLREELSNESGAE